MKARKTPQQKKQLSYERDHVNVAYNSDKGSRKSWPLKEARMARQFRRKVAQTLRPGGTDNADEVESAVRCIPRKEVKKWGAISLGESLARRVEARDQREGRHKAEHDFYDANGITYPSQLSKPRKKQ